jgi:DNA excision repair protein ERCC-2
MQKTIPARTTSVSVRELVEFVLRTGNLGGTRDFMSASRALDGTRGHQRLQKLRPEGYRAEVRVKYELVRPEFILLINGRIDGVLEATDSLLIEEIKTVTGHWDRTRDPLHWAQASIYAYLFALQKEYRGKIQVQLTYLHLESEEVMQFGEPAMFEQLELFFLSVANVYLEWAERQHEWMKLRNQSIASLNFPHGEYRVGQRALAVAAYRAFANGTKLFAEAPTGIGKTVSVIFPAFKALGEGHLEKIFFLTAKTTGRATAQGCVAQMHSTGLRLRCLTLTARDKICFNNGQPCETQSCPFAIGYYDRVKAAIQEALSSEMLDTDSIRAIARSHNVCPFELSLDVSLWVDLIVCDYNYVFDPRVSLKRFFAEEGGDYAFLVDEAHNLVDRAREMFSGEITLDELVETRTALNDAVPRCAKALRKLERFFAEQEARLRDQPSLVTRELPADLLKLLGSFMEEAAEWLALNEPSDFRMPLLECYFRALGFARTAELFDDRYVSIVDKNDGDRRVRLFCLDPGRGIQQALSRGKSSVFFSATLRPVEYYRELLGGDIADTAIQLTSPFPPEHLAVIVQDRIQTSFRARDASYGEVARAISALVQGRAGNYLVFFPSYKYLEAVRTEFEANNPFVPLIYQSSNMSDSEREKFILAFQADVTRPLVGFAVMGGIFGEGIDLVGDRLIGAAVVGIGLPQLSLERDLIREYFNSKNGQGFEYAYAWPGLTRVIQAAGRVIRSEKDLGAVLLIDSRFRERRYRELLPAWWQIEAADDYATVSARVKEFWTSANGR